MAAADLPGWYLPVDGYLWDPWFHRSGDVVHLFHLFQAAPPGRTRASVFPRDRPVIAHATWTRAEGWQSRGTALDYTGAPYDEDRIHTGCVTNHDGTFAMLYSGSNQFLCLAHSGDLDHWVKDPDNPVLSPDPARYRKRWRDPWLLQGLTGERHTVVIAAQYATHTGPPIGTVAVAHSPDLHHWRQDTPLLIPAWFTWLEVPELHHLDGLSYLVFATREQWITPAGRDALRAHGLPARDGAYYLMSATWRGPYESIGSLSEGPESGYTTRLLETAASEQWLWSHVEYDRTGTPVFGLQAPRSCTVATSQGQVPSAAHAVTAGQVGHR